MVQSKTRSTRPDGGRRYIPARPTREAPSTDPFLRFHHPAPLRKKTLAVLDRLEASTDPTDHREALADIVVELTRSGMDAYFMKPLKRAKAGFITEQSAHLGMAGAMQVLSSVIRRIIGGMGSPQLLSVSGSVRQFME